MNRKYRIREVHYASARILFHVDWSWTGENIWHEFEPQFRGFTLYSDANASLNRCKRDHADVTVVEIKYHENV